MKATTSISLDETLKEAIQNRPVMKRSGLYTDLLERYVDRVREPGTAGGAA